MRASIILRNNWLCTKILQLECMDISDLWKLEYCNDQDLNKNKPTKQVIKEVPFIQNNPRYKQAQEEASGKKPSEGAENSNEPQLTEKQKRIAELKKSLLAPQTKKKAEETHAITRQAAKDDPMDSKFKRVMDWGTPRLVTKNRQLNMTGKQIESRGMLLGMANIRTGNVQNLKAAPKQEFA